MSVIENLQALILAALVIITTGKVPSPQPAIPTPTPTIFHGQVVVDETKIGNYKAEGKYSYLLLTVNYSLNFPKNGGDMNGTFSGVCSGTITGKFTKSVGQMQGTLHGDCDTPLYKGKFDQPFFARVNESEKILELEIRNIQVLDVIGTLKIPFN